MASRRPGEPRKGEARRGKSFREYVERAGLGEKCQEISSWGLLPGPTPRSRDREEFFPKAFREVKQVSETHFVCKGELL